MARLKAALAPWAATGREGGRKVDLGLRGKVAAITGGSDGIGKAAARVIASEGGQVAICARRTDALERAAQEIRAASGGEVLAVQADVTKPQELEAFIGQVLERFGRIDILVNNAGTHALGPFESISDEAWLGDLDLKVLAAIRCSRLVIPHMRRQGGGRIINITHVGGKQPGPRSMPTSVSRAAGIAFTKGLSKEYAEHNILVNTVCVGIVKSGQWKRIREEHGFAGSLEEFYEKVARDRAIPLKRMGETDEAANVVVFLASQMASYITGASINVDGGLSAVV